LKRIILLFAGGLSALSIIITAIMIHFAAYWKFTDRLKKEAAIDLEYARTGVELAGIEYLHSLTPHPHRLTLIDTDGTVLFDNSKDLREMENHLERPEVQEAIASGEGEGMRYSGTGKEQTWYHSARLKNGKILRIAVTTHTALASALNMIPISICIIIAVFILNIIIATFITKRIVLPVNRINPEKPEENEVYEEFSPLLRRLKEQQDVITSQMEAMRNRQMEFQAITDNMREGLLLLDREGAVLSFNKSAHALLGSNYDKHHKNNNPPFHIFTLYREDSFKKAVEEAIAGHSAEAVIKVKKHLIRLMANPVPDSDKSSGEILGAVLLLLDVTEKKERENLRREFSANVSHELKTPLTSISGYSEIIASGLAKPGDCRKFGAQIYEETQRLITLINNILQLSHLDEGGGAGLQFEKVSVRKIADAAINRIIDRARERNISISLSGDNGEIKGVPGVLEEIIFNLLENSVKYNYDGGKITILIRKSEKELSLSVADSGIGIPEEEQERIFERFYRADKSRGKTPGTGLGLSIVKRGALLHNAKIKLESKEKAGTTITVFFPL
jgi:two-component system phosphate regulon sensor histidine kinase PhoR